MINATSTTSASRADANEKAVPVEQLLNGRRELAILHNGERYQLRITGNNKLLLTK